MTMKAKKLEQLDTWQGAAAVYKLSDPLDGHEFVVVSTVVPFDTGCEETMIFPSDKDGKVTDWRELAVCYGKTHAETLQGEGYEIEPGD